MTHPTHFACNGACIAGAPEPYPELTEDEWAWIAAMSDQIEQEWCSGVVPTVTDEEWAQLEAELGLSGYGPR